MRRATTLSSLLALLLLACATGTTPTPSAAPAAPTASSGLPDDIAWVEDSAEYEAAVYQAFALATARVDALSAGRAPGSWAVSLDADETVLSNLGYELELEDHSHGFQEHSWRGWVARAKATAIPGATAFLAHVQQLGGKVLIVTNRDEDQRAPTEANLRAAGVPFDLVLMRPQPDASQKEPRWQAVEAGTAAPGMAAMKILLWVGDNIQDFPDLDQSLHGKPASAYAAFGDRYIVIPNPMYGSWKKTK
jgi:5'-nucleotidase (lipoprotein e(P4) family)